MHSESSEYFKVEQISLLGPGVIILTGPSSCGKGEVAAALCKVMSIPASDHLSMGEILRSTIHQARNNPDYARLLEKSYGISASFNIFDCLDTSEELSAKVLKHVERMEAYFQRDNMREFTSQLDWLEYCTMNGLLVPDRWTQNFIAAHIEHAGRFQLKPFIIDGYPRTVAAAEHLLAFLQRQQIPVIKVLHLSISKQEMITRARARGRADDDLSSLQSRFQFYIENVQPSVDYMKMELGSEVIALIDAHQPVYTGENGHRQLDLPRSIANVVAHALRNLGVPRVIVRDIVADLIQERLAAQ
jgi:adenylate kinase family enzyme